MALTANINRDSKKQPKPFAVEDFLPPDPDKKPEPEMTSEEIVRQLKSVFGDSVKVKEVKRG